MNSKDGRPFTANPMLLLISGLCPVLIPSFTFQNGLIMGLGVALHAIILAALIPLLSRVINMSLRFSLVLTLSAMITVLYGLVIRLAFSASALGLSPFLAFIALNCFGLSVIKGSMRQDSLERFPEYFRSAGLLLITIVFFSVIRELLGSGMITFYRTESASLILDLRNLIRVPIRMALFPSGAFILLGYAVAGYRARAKHKGGIKA